MKDLLVSAIAFLGLTLTAVVGRGDGGSPTAPPSNTGGGTSGGTDPVPSVQEWKARIVTAYADGTVSRSERKEIIRFLRSMPRPDRLRYFLSWTRLKMQVARSKNPVVVSGVVAVWATADPAIGAGWLNNLPRR